MSIVPVTELYHLYFCSVDGEHRVMTAHVELKLDVSVSQLKTLKDELRHGLDEFDFDFAHTTIEIEFANEDCRDEQTEL
ncbi:MAG: cobalt-zinc-cadmium efflux system protein [Paraglaciecola sp.]|jgi:cobalt-zinc-cadmium efflux system protein